MEIYKRDIVALAEKLIPHTLVKTPLGRARLLKKYPYMAQCSNGCWNWNEIYLAENGIVLSDRMREIKQREQDEDRTD